MISGCRVTGSILEAGEAFNYTTPKSFLELIGFYITPLNKQAQGGLYRVNCRLDTGLSIPMRTNKASRKSF
jgi:hypothetical protein